MQFLLPLFPEFSTQFCLKIASSRQCFSRVASKLPQVLPQKSMLLIDRDIDVIAIIQ